MCNYVTNQHLTDIIYAPVGFGLEKVSRTCSRITSCTGCCFKYYAINLNALFNSNDSRLGRVFVYITFNVKVLKQLSFGVQHTVGLNVIKQVPRFPG